MVSSTRQPLTGDVIVRDYALDAVGNRQNVGVTVGQGATAQQDYAMQEPEAPVNEYSATPFEASREQDANGNLNIRDRDRITESEFEYDYRNLMVRSERKLADLTPPAPSAINVAWHDNFSSGLSGNWDDGVANLWGVTDGNLAQTSFSTSGAIQHDVGSNNDFGLWFRYTNMDVYAEDNSHYTTLFVRTDELNDPDSSTRLGVRIHNDHLALVQSTGSALFTSSTTIETLEGSWYWMYIECVGQTVRVYRGTSQEEMVLVLSAGANEVPAPTQDTEGCVGIWQPFQFGDYRFDDFTMVEQPETDIVEASYVYDALGRRIQKIVGSATTRYVYHGARVIEEYDDANTLQASYVYGNYVDDIVTMRRGSLDYFYHADDLYNVHALTNADGDVVERYEYGDYGEPELYNADDDPLTGSLVGNTNLFTGQRYDTETGFYWCKTRYLEAETGRFTARDPIGIWGDPLNLGNGYTYAGNNPWSRLDPFGMCSEEGEEEEEDEGWLEWLSDAVVDAIEAVGDVIGDVVDSIIEDYFPFEDMTGISPVDEYAYLDPDFDLDQFTNGGRPELIGAGTQLGEKGNEALAAMREAAQAAAIDIGAGKAAGTIGSAAGWADEVPLAGAADNVATGGLPVLRIPANKYPDLAQNIQHAQNAGRPSILTYGGNRRANYNAATQGIPNIPGYTRDEYPFASTMEGGAGAWIGHIPERQQHAQGALLKNFYQRNNMRPGDQFQVEIVP